MHDTKYSSGPKFFGTTAKSIPFVMKNHGLTKVIGALQDQELIKYID